MAQLVNAKDQLECQLKLESPADKVYDVYRNKCYLFPTIMPLDIAKITLVKGDWVSKGSERLWTFVDDSCGSWLDIVESIADQKKSITFALLDGEVPKEHYKSLKVDYQFSAADQGCTAKAVLTFEKKNANAPEPDEYIKFICKMFKAVDEYLQTI